MKKEIIYALVTLVAIITLISCDKEIYADTEPAPMEWYGRTDSVGGFELSIKIPDFISVPDSHKVFTLIHIKPEKYDWSDKETDIRDGINHNFTIRSGGNVSSKPNCFIGKYRMVGFITVVDYRYAGYTPIHRIYTCFRNAEVFTQQRTKVCFDDFSPITEEDSIMFDHAPMAFFYDSPW